MSSKYNEAMDKIKMSDELKEKIKSETAKKLRAKKKKAPVIYIRFAAAVAACIVICFAAVRVFTPREAGPDGPVIAVNPFEEFSGIGELSEKTPFELKTPQYLPVGYEFSSAALMVGETAEINYKNADEEISYRCAESDSDVSGDCNTYEEEKKAKIKNAEVTVKGKDGKVFLATWLSGKMSFSLSSTAGISEEETLKIIESIK